MPTSDRLKARLLRWVLVSLLYTPLVTSTVLSKLSMPKLAAAGLGLGIPITLLATGLGVVLGFLVLDVAGFFFYGALIATILLIQAVGALPLSLGSIALLIFLFVPCVVRLREQTAQAAPVTTADVRRFLVSFSTCFAIVGIGQYFGQYVVGAKIAFPIEHFLPDPLLIKSYNYLNPLTYGGRIYKANGVVFLEPSFFSQFMALALLLEISMRPRWWRIALYLAAIALSFSGTGVIVLALGLAGLIVYERRWGIAFVAVMLATLAVIFAEPLGIGRQLSRLGEFQNTGTSGFMRFVAWVYMFREHWWGDLGRVLFGVGAGSFTTYSAESTYNTSEMSFSKMFFEFGVVGGLLFFGFQFFLVARSSMPVGLKVGVAVTLLMNAAYSLQAVGLLLTLFIWPVRTAPADHGVTAARNAT